MSRQSISERFEIDRQIGAGGMATVWLGRDLSLDRLVAIKRLHPHIASDGRAADRFKREALAAASLTHPGVVTVLDAGEDHLGPFIIMEYVEGETLADLMARQGALSPERAVDIATPAAEALGHAHAKGLVHRDVKPGNILITVDGRVKLADFGIAKSIEETHQITRTGTVVGTVAYLAPEQAAGDPATPASDVYSLGVVLYEMLTGQVPFTGETPLAVAMAHQTLSAVPPSSLASVPASLEAVALRAMEKDPGKRFPSGAEMAAGLRAEQGGISAPMGPADTRPMPARRAATPTAVLPQAPSRRGSRLRTVAPWLLGLAALLLAAAMLVILGARNTPIDAPTQPTSQTTATTAAATTTSVPTTTTPVAATAPRTTVLTPEGAFAGVQDFLEDSASNGAIHRKVWNELRKLAEDAEEKWRDGDLKESSKKLEELVRKAREKERDGEIQSGEFVFRLEEHVQRVRETAGLPPPEEDDDDD